MTKEFLGKLKRESGSSEPKTPHALTTFEERHKASVEFFQIYDQALKTILDIMLEQAGQPLVEVDLLAKAAQKGVALDVAGRVVWDLLDNDKLHYTDEECAYLALVDSVE